MFPQGSPTTSFMGSQQGINLLGSPQIQATPQGTGAASLMNNTAPASNSNVAGMVKALKGG